MKLYPIFLVLAAVTVLSPGPGVLMTLTNSVRDGRRGTLGGILGLALGALLIAALSATGLGVVLAASALAFTLIKLLGAAYLVYLGVRLWRAAPPRLGDRPSSPTGFRRRFLEGISIQLTNPKALAFFLAVFPQFIDRQRPFATQFAALILTYAALIVMIHCGYAFTARRARRWIGSERGGRMVNRLGGAAFCGFGLALAAQRR